jgi:CHAT domain-containing protein/tetratricopeptide (TPR) repeat protein
MPRELPSGRRGLEMGGGGYAEPRGTHPLNRGYRRRDLADMYEVSTDFASAEVQLWCELVEDQSTQGEDHPQVAMRLGRLSDLYQSAGIYAAAEPLRMRTVEILQRAYGERDIRYIEGVIGLARLYRASGAHRASETLYLKALEILRGSAGSDHPLYTTALLEQSDLYRALGELAAAAPLLNDLVEIARRNYGEQTREFAFALYDLAEFHLSSGDYVSAKEQFRRVLKIDRATRDETDPNIAASLNNMAYIHLILGEYVDAERLFRESQRIESTTRGLDHPDNASIMINLAWVLTATGRIDEAIELITQASAIDDGLIGRVVAICSEAQRMALLARVRSHEEMALSLIFRGDGRSSGALVSGLDLVIRRKALGAELLAAQRDLAREQSNALGPEQLAQLRQKIARVVMAGPDAEGAEEHGRLVGRLNHQMAELELDLARWVPRKDIWRGWREADHNRVALNLPEDSIFVEFVRLHVFNFNAVPCRGDPCWGPARYLAFVVPAREAASVRAIDLGEAAPIDELIRGLRRSITGEDVSAVRDMVVDRSSLNDVSPVDRGRAGAALRAAVFDPLVPFFHGRTRLLLAPEGDLCRLPFEVLPDRTGRSLIDDYAISYLSCGRDLLRHGVRSSVRPTAPLVVADPDFDLGVGDSSPTPALMPARTGRVARERVAAGGIFERLPGTRLEGEAVARLLGVHPWLGANALEGRLKAHCQSPAFLHIATHGFFLENQDEHARSPSPYALVPKRESNPIGVLDRLTGALPENPLLRSGLALAGANTWLRRGDAPIDAEDGLLTAEDIVDLDLRATELVVLSGCETGLGEIRTGEGVFGLRRAFFLAGARTLVMSLWKVPDGPTEELMEEFYHRLWAGVPKAEALRKAQLTMKAKDPDPFCWGAFICQGDPGPVPWGAIRGY